MVSVREWLTEHKHAYYPEEKSKWITDCSLALDVSRKSVQNYSGKIWNEPTMPNDSIIKSTKTKIASGAGMSKKEFVDRYDENTRIRNAIKKGIEKLEQDKIFEEKEFREDLCELRNAQGFRKVAYQEEFSKFHFGISEKFFWAHPKTVLWALDKVTKAKRIIY